ncbi:hypothetical protein LCGC14_1173990 [marine sediment metagenome]|uniref:Uncharacterized protein n=1 Tax=marine sediment metagenome TaxID=412755 RepID=A0A0F9LTZ3_9ZZZZ
MAKKIEKGSDLKKVNTIVWLIAGVLTILLTLYTFFIIADLRNLIP